MRQGDVLCWVYSTTGDTRKEEFIPPEHSTLHTGKSNEAYIEAVDDERFGICFGIPTSLVKEHGADTVCIELDIDKGATSLALVLKVRDQATICEKIDSFTCLKEGDWQECGFSFRKMRLDEDLILSHEEANGEVKTFGTIKVTIMRGHSQERSDKNGGIISSSNRRLDHHVSSKRVIKDNGISHSVKYGRRLPTIRMRSGLPGNSTPVLRSIKNRRGVPLKFIHLAYPNCHIATFVFKYRSQMSLELKKIVGEDQANRLDEEKARRAKKRRQNTAPEDLNTERQRRGTIAFVSEPQRLKRESVDIHGLEMLNERDAGSPTKRRKSMPSSFEPRMKPEPVVRDIENSEEAFAIWPPST